MINGKLCHRRVENAHIFIIISIFFKKVLEKITKM